MKVIWYKILDYNFPELKLELNVGSGTYIRSIGYRLGQEFGLGGVLTSLRRTSIGEFDLERMELEKIGDELYWREIEN
jgi:tRNA pseudouridine55 synthase